MPRSPAPRRKRFGQHFLEPAWVARVVDAIGPAPGDRFVEIGPGSGELTLPLAARVASVLAIEIDRDLAAVLNRRRPPNVEISVGDVLDADLPRTLARLGDGRVRVAGNLPYNISSPVIFRLVAAARGQPRLHDAVLMLQREVADRLVARVGTKAYGVLTILVGAAAEVSRLLAVPAGAFRPVPRVSSALVRLRFRPSGVPIADPALLEVMVKGLFSRRRKTLANALLPVAAGRGLDARELLARAGLDPRRRPETLELADLARLTELLATPETPPVL